MADCCKSLGILCSYSCPLRSGHNVPVNLQHDKSYFLFCKFLSLYDCKSVIPLKVRALRMGYPVYFRLYATVFYKSCRASMTKHRQQRTKVRARFNMESGFFLLCHSSFRHQASNSESSPPLVPRHFSTSSAQLSLFQQDRDGTSASPPAGFDCSLIQQFNKRRSRHCYRCRGDRDAKD